MRTTVTIDPDVEALLKNALRERDVSFKQLVNDSLRQALADPKGRKRAPFKPLTFSMGRPLVDLTKATSFAAELEDQELVARLSARA